MRSLKSLQSRMDALERAEGGPEVFVLLFGDECSEFDRARETGDPAAMLEVLRRANPHTDEAVLEQVARGDAQWTNLDRATLVRAEYGESI